MDALTVESAPMDYSMHSAGAPRRPNTKVSASAQTTSSSRNGGSTSGFVVVYDQGDDRQARALRAGIALGPLRPGVPLVPRFTGEDRKRTRPFRYEGPFSTRSRGQPSYG